MGFVTKLFSIFVPLILGMIVFFQRDHIFTAEQNHYLEEQFTKIAAQFNYHLDAVEQQLNDYVAEQKELVGTDEVDLKEKVIKRAVEEPTQAKEAKQDDEVKLDAKSSAANGVESHQKSTDDQKKKNNKCDLGNDLLITKEQLARYNGEDPKKKIYLAFLGIVYDVSKGEQHYAPGGAYSMFTGKDASRAFITGDFSESGLTDDLSGLKAESFSGVQEWSDFYLKTYRRIGRLVGAFYDQNGCPTQQVRFIEEQLEKANQDSLDDQLENELFPPCNTEWNKAKKETRFWCTKQSGGIQRDWTGVPRQLFNLKGNKKDFRCACVRDFGPETKNAIEYADEEESGAKKDTPDNVGDLNNPRVREFEQCSAKSTECVLKDKQ